MSSFLDFIFNIDQSLDMFLRDYGVWVYVILFLIIFVETGLVVMPFLPGDSLLFAAGAIAARGSLDVVLLLVLCSLGAILGDTLNYGLGKAVGRQLFSKNENGFLKKEYLTRTEAFYERHGRKTIIFARFIPIVRTFAPFVAGIARMHYPVFATFNIVGGIFWVVMFILGGFYFGTIPFVEERFSLVIAAIVIISFVPVVVEYVRYRKRKHGV